MTHTRAAWYTALAYALWGLFPLYWKFLAAIPALQLTCHRIVWSCAVLVLLITAAGEWRAMWAAIRMPRVIAIYTTAALAIAMNWLIFVWAVSDARIVEISLGYFINPLLNVVMGVMFFRERLRRLQWASVVLAGAGVIFVTLSSGTPPWIALALAASFGAYGLLKKIAPLNPVHGLTLETSVLCAPAGFYLIATETAGTGAFMHAGLTRDVMMVAAGPVTTLPLLLFAAGVQRIPLSLVGMLQYITPTMQFLFAVFVYHEPFTRELLVGFTLVWTALAVFAADGSIRSNSSPAKAGHISG